MTKSPLHTTENDRSAAFNTLWIGLLDTILVIATVFVPALEALQSIAVAIMSGTLIGLVFISLHDEFVQRLIGRSATIACAVVGVLALLEIELIRSYLEVSPVLGFALISLAFHLSLATMRLRGGI